jgi:hypothetical protein
MRWWQLFTRGVVVSFPKSGRTWMRIMLDDLGVWLAYDSAGSGHRMQISAEELVPPKILVGKRKVIFLHRDPRDTVVSGYFQASRRRTNCYKGTLSEFIRDPRHGIEKVVRYNHAWLDAIAGRKDAIDVRYEDLHDDTAAVLRRIAVFVGKCPSDARIARAVNEGRFEVMQAREADGTYARSYGTRLLPKNPSDPESFKVRRGKVGGWEDYLAAEDAAYCTEVMRSVSSEVKPV